VITDWCDDFLACKLCDLVLRLVNAAHGRTLGRDECARLLESSAFDEVTVSAYRLDWLWGLMTARGRRDGSASAR
jgi:hypothetical protein